MIAKKIPCVTYRIKQPVSHKMWRETFLGTQIVFIWGPVLVLKKAKLQFLPITFNIQDMFLNCFFVKVWLKSKFYAHKNQYLYLFKLFGLYILHIHYKKLLIEFVNVVDILLYYFYRNKDPLFLSDKTLTLPKTLLFFYFLTPTVTYVIS